MRQREDLKQIGNRAAQSAHSRRAGCPMTTAGPCRAFWLLAVLIFGGCREKVVVTELPPSEQNLRYIVMAYTQAATDLGRSPQNLDQLKPILQDFGDPEQLSRSPRDGEPYVIVGGLNLRGPFKDGMPIIAYERTGKDGKRQVVDLQMTVRELTREEFARLKFPPGHKPPPMQ